MLNLVDIRKSFGRIVAVDGLSLSVRKGEVLGLLEPNGDRIAIVDAGRLLALGTLSELLAAHGGPPTLGRGGMVLHLRVAHSCHRSLWHHVRRQRQR